MRMTGIGVIAAAILAGSMGIAAAQTSTTTTTSPSAATGTVKCWDSVTKQVRNETPSSSSGSRTSSMSGTSTSSTATGWSSSSSSTRPPEAAGLPDCKH